MESKILEFPKANDNSTSAIPRQVSLGALLDGLEKRYPHLKIDGQNMEVSFSTWLMLLTDKRVARGLNAIAEGADKLGYTLSDIVAEMIDEYIECSMDPLIHAKSR